MRFRQQHESTENTGSKFSTYTPPESAQTQEPAPTQTEQTETTAGKSQIAPSVEMQAKVLQQAVQQRRRYKWIFGTAFVGSGTSLYGLLQLMQHGQLIGGEKALGILDVLGLYALLFATMFAGENRLRQSARALASTEDTCAVGALVEALRSGDPTCNIAVTALLRLLPRLDAPALENLTPYQRACLRRALQASASRYRFWKYNPTFALTILRALEKTEPDAQTVDVVRQIAESEGGAVLQQRLGATARRCLRIWQAREASFFSPSEVQDALLEAAQHGETDTQSEEAEEVFAQLNRLARQHRKNNLYLSLLAGTSAFTGLANAFLMGQAAHAHLPPAGPGPLISISLAALLGVFCLAIPGIYRFRNMASALSSSDDLRVVGAILDVVSTGEQGGTAEMGLNILTRLLPKMQASDASLLNEKQRATLIQCLAAYGKNTEFVLACLKALEQIGDGKALPVVEKLARGKARTAVQKRIQQAAQECLPFLQQRADKERASQTLLRASGLTDTDTSHLLRPVENVSPTEPHELLRPGTPRMEFDDEEVSERERTDRSAPPTDAFGALRWLSE